ncbi:P-loop containing nucleoside triphosphate hydrolase protein [Syncephalis plumigaleata]|nr:P-loop containing nucleoside triphosphate hydrolase protein [Syncephalis plumigaleata]
MSTVTLLAHYRTRLFTTSYESRYASLVLPRLWRHSSRLVTRPIKSTGQHAYFASKANDVAVDRIRNIGIIAHIDAGKTTTTERMLYYAGLTRRIGEVDSGDTVTDYLVQERERGITIQAAAVTLGWRDAKINLIDTPGHVDFTVEVERSIRVLDGAVAVLDGAAGVEAQTETVWQQADRYQIPRLVFANKMDRVGASWTRVLSDLSSVLGATPLPVQLPYFDGTQFVGVIDVIDMSVLTWNKTDTGSQYQRTALDSKHSQYAEAMTARDTLVQQLAELDDEMMELFLLAEDNHEQQQSPITTSSIQMALRRVTLASRAVPVLCGSSLRNMGVQPLMDAIVDYLPSPLDCTAPQGILEDGSTVQIGADANSANCISPTADKQAMCALAFKVISDIQRGVMENRAVLYNVNNQVKERVSRVFEMYGDQTESLDQLAAGNIGVLVGLKNTRTGDTLVLEQQHRRQRRSVPRLAGVTIPPPVFFRSVEPVSHADEQPLQEALDHLLLEDPSLRVRFDRESGQTLLCGQGELHLEVVGDRLKRDFKVQADLGKVRISYRETIASNYQVTHLYDREIFGTRGRAQISITLVPMTADPETGKPVSPYEEGSVDGEGNVIVVDPTCITSNGDANTQASPLVLSDTMIATIVQSVRDGIEAGLARGTLLGFPVTHVAVKVDQLVIFGDESTSAALRACAGEAVGEGLAQAHATLLEPTMRVQIRVPTRYVGPVMSDLSGGTRRGRILSMDEGDEEENAVEGGGSETSATTSQYRRLLASVPLAGLLGYASILRSLTAGTGTFTMELYGYGAVATAQQQAILAEMRGY